MQKTIKLPGGIAVIDNDLLSTCGDALCKFISPCKIAVITDKNVDALYYQTVATSLEKSGFSLIKYVIESGEASKSLNEYCKIMTFLAQNDFTGGDVLLSLGGGVVSDLGGFAASTYHRGIKHVIIPTTILSAIDAAIGGKTAVNLPEGKNLVGTFYMPSVVLVDTSAFSSLGERERNEGWGELCKYSLLVGEEYDVNALKKPSTMSDIVLKCIEFKAKIVENDAFDKGERHILNLGHTIGHAIEKSSNYAVPHGIAVYYGLRVVVEQCYKHGFMPKEQYDKCRAVIESYQIIYDFVLSVRDLVAQITADKKRDGDKITLALLRGFGQPFLMTMTVEEAKRFLCE